MAESIFESRIKDKGQMTIPSGARKIMNLHEGEDVIIFATKDEIVVRPKVKQPLKKAGMLGKEKGVKRVKDLTLRYKGL